jgi:hypothetical protein
VRRGCYANGATTIAGVGLPTPAQAAQMDAGVATRAVGNLRFVYPWVIRVRSTMREFVRIGCDGVMVDTSEGDDLAAVLREPEFLGQVHAATRADDPFAEDYTPLLQVRTADVAHAGTDARISFVLELASGRKIVKSVDAALVGRFERGSLNFVLLPGESFALTEARTITVSHDGGGNAPDWELASITLRKRGDLDRTVTFDRVVKTGFPEQGEF